MTHLNVLLMMVAFGLAGCKAVTTEDNSIHPAIDPVYYKSLPVQNATQALVADQHSSPPAHEPASAPQDAAHVAPMKKVAPTKKNILRKGKEASYLSPGMGQQPN